MPPRGGCGGRAPGQRQAGRHSATSLSSPGALRFCTLRHPASQPQVNPSPPCSLPSPPPTPPHPRLQVFDDYLRKRASKLGANLINGLFMGIETTQGAEGPITIRYNEYKEGKWLPARLGWLGLRWLMLASVEPACRMRGFSNNWRWPGVVLRAASAAAAAASPSPAAHTSSTHPPPTVPTAPPAPPPPTLPPPQARRWASPAPWRWTS